MKSYISKNPTLVCIDWIPRRVSVCLSLGIVFFWAKNVSSSGKAIVEVYFSKTFFQLVSWSFLFIVCMFQARNQLKSIWVPIVGFSSRF